MSVTAEIRKQLILDEWQESHRPFWWETPCFYDLSKIRTVLLFKNADGSVNETLYFWKHHDQPLPSYLNSDQVELRRYKLHHSMNDLLWHNHEDFEILP